MNKVRLIRHHEFMPEGSYKIVYLDIFNSQTVFTVISDYEAIAEYNDGQVRTTKRTHED